MIIIKSKEELQLMRKAGEISAIILHCLSDFVKPGLKAIDLDRKACDYFKKYNVKSLFLGYKGFPGNICVAINEEVVHGIPSNKIMKEGDIVNIDVGVIYKGYCADVGATFPCGNISRENEKLLKVTQEALMLGIKEAKAGERLGKVSYAIQSYAEKNGYSVVRQLCGHGIGKTMHEEPQVPNYGNPSDGPILRSGMTLAIEPMINMGSHEVVVAPDGWTVITLDKKPSCQFEHTIAIYNGEPEILTKLPE